MCLDVLVKFRAAIGKPAVNIGFGHRERMISRIGYLNQERIAGVLICRCLFVRVRDGQNALHLRLIDNNSHSEKALLRAVDLIPQALHDVLCCFELIPRIILRRRFLLLREHKTEQPVADMGDAEAVAEFNGGIEIIRNPVRKLGKRTRFCCRSCHRNSSCCRRKLCE